jgi:membrane-associated phospholipid phosphatase
VVNCNLAWQEAAAVDIVGKMSSCSSQKRITSRRAIGVLAFTAVAAAMSGFDAMVFHWLSLQGQPGDVKKIISLFEIFGHGTGVVVVALLIRVLDSSGVTRSVTVLAGGFLAGLVSAIFKSFLIRIRPSQYRDLVGEAMPFEGMTGFRWSRAFLSDPNDASHGFFHDAIHSFPSGHTATACAMAWCLSRMYPNGRFVFWGFAIMVAAQRLFAQAHYLSDTIAGAMIGVVIAIFLDHCQGRIRS